MSNEKRDKRTITQIRRRSRALLREMTPAEKALWGRLQDRKLDGLKFRFQHPLGSFTADFCCLERNVVVVIEGDEDSPSRDPERARQLEQHGYRILRFTADQITSDLESAVEAIRAACAEPGQ